MRRLETYEGVVEDGHVKLPPNARIPENTRVYVLVPDAEMLSVPYVASPHLTSPKQAKDFEKVVIEETKDAEI